MDYRNITLFILGGLILVSTKYLTNYISPKFGSIISTIPIGLFSAYFIIEESKIKKYLVSYIKQVIFILAISFLYLFLFNKFDHRTVFIICLMIWLVFILIELYFR